MTQKQSYTYTMDDLRKFADLWDKDNTLVQIAHTLKLTHKMADALYQAAKKRGMLKPRQVKSPHKKTRTVSVPLKSDAHAKLVSVVDAESHKMGQIAKFAWDVLRAQL